MQNVEVKGRVLEQVIKEFQQMQDSMQCCDVIRSELVGDTQYCKEQIVLYEIVNRLKEDIDLGIKQLRELKPPNKE